MLTIQGGAVSTPRIPVINGSVFAPVNYQDTHQSTDWQIATDPGFTSLAAVSNGNTVNKTTWSPATALTAKTTFYARARYNGTGYTSEWSDPVSFTTGYRF